MGRRPLKWPIFKILGCKFWPILAVFTSLKSQFPDFCGDFFVSLNFGILLSGRGQQGSPRWGSNVDLTNIWGGTPDFDSKIKKVEKWNLKKCPPPDMGVRPPCDQHLGGIKFSTLFLGILWITVITNLLGYTGPTTRPLMTEYRPSSSLVCV